MGTGTRAQAHAAVAKALHSSADNEWAAVCYFYAAWHLATEALRSDPVFDNPTRLHSINVDLIPDDRTTERHKGRRRTPGGDREWGVNELMLLLYDQPIAAAYDKLHQASIEVRYGDGLRTPLNEVRRWFDLLEEAAIAGRLVCGKFLDQ